MPRRIDGAKVAAMMDERDWTIADLATHSGLSASTIGRIKKNEEHKSSNFTVKSLARAFGCEPADLYKPEAIKEAINESLAQKASNVVAEAVAEAVTVVMEEVAPDVPQETVASTIPSMEVNFPFDLNVQAYFDRMVARHEDEVETLKKTHSDHLADLRRECRHWRTISAVCAIAAVALFVYTILHIG